MKFEECKTHDDFEEWAKEATAKEMEEVLEKLEVQKNKVRDLQLSVRKVLNAKLQEEAVIQKLSRMKPDEMKAAGVNPDLMKKVEEYKKNKAEFDQKAAPQPVVVGAGVKKK